MRRLLLALSCLMAIQIHAQIIGLAIDSLGAPISGLQIYDKAAGKIGQSKLDGYFKLELNPGQYIIVFSHPSFHTTELPVVVKDKTKDTILVRLHPKSERLNTVHIYTVWKDPGPDYMRKAIKRRDYWSKRIPPQSAEVYIKAIEEIKQKKQRTISAETSDPYQPENHASDLSNTYNFAEIDMTRDWSPPNKIKEVKHGVKWLGDKTSLFYLSTVEGDFNIYQNLMSLRGLCPLPVMSPLSNSALLAYKFRFIESYQHAQYGRVLKIRFDGRQTANSTFSGEIHLVDTSFYVSKIILDVPKHLMAEYEQMKLVQNYRITKDSFILIDSQRFEYMSKAGSSKYVGQTKVMYNDIKIFPNFPKNHFGLELSKVEQDAYEKDSSFWKSRRSIPLSNIEQKYISVSDSIKRAHSSDQYLDSLERLANKISLKSLFLEGQDYQNRKKGINFNFQPLMFIWQPWWPGGSRIVLWNTLDKTFTNKKNVRFVENLSYGLNNKDIRGTIVASTLYNPYKRKLIYAAAGRDFGFVNPYAAYVDLFRRDNFYQHDHLTLYHRQELVNGLFFRVTGEFSDRKDISSFKFSKYGDSLFENNNPLKFRPHTATFCSINLSYTPFQRYMSEPKQKVILGSTWPTFSIDYRRAIPGILGSTINYEYLEFRIDHIFPWGLLGKSELKFNSGSFLSHKNINVIDYRYQRRGDISIFTPPMFAYQLLDSTFKTFKRFYELHYRHHFNGSIVNKIPAMKKLGLYESAGISALYAPERRNMMYYEFYVGIDKLIRIWRERFKIGFYYAVGYSNIFNAPRTAFKINFEFYNRSTNSW